MNRWLGINSAKKILRPIKIMLTVKRYILVENTFHRIIQVPKYVWKKYCPIFNSNLKREFSTLAKWPCASKRSIFPLVIVNNVLSKGSFLAYILFHYCKHNTQTLYYTLFLFFAKLYNVATPAWPFLYIINFRDSPFSSLAFEVFRLAATKQ